MHRFYVVLVLCLFSLGCEFKDSPVKEYEDEYWEVICPHRPRGILVMYKVRKGLTYPYKESSGLWQFVIDRDGKKKKIISSMCFIEVDV